jgi:hypothetical protein
MRLELIKINYQCKYSRYNKSNVLFVMAVMLLMALIYTSQSQSIVNRIVPDSNKVLIYLTDTTSSFKTSLSEDKYRISIQIDNAYIAEGIKSVIGSGVVREVNTVTYGSSAELSINLNDRIGYTAVWLPFSRAIQIDLFRWDNLNPAEDDYRSGLLALEDKIDKAATEYLRKSANAGSANASAFYGLIEMQKGNIGTSANYLKKALLGKTNLWDAYAAVSQICRMKGLNDQSQKFRDYFLKKSGLSYLNELPLETKINQNDAGADINEAYFQELSYSLNDTISLSHEDSLSKNMFPNLFSGDTTRSQNADSNDSKGSLLPDWFPYVAGFALVFIIAMAGLIIVSFNRWKKNQLLKANINKRMRFEESLKSAGTNIQSARKKASEQYQRTGSLLDKTIGEEEIASPEEPVTTVPLEKEADAQVQSEIEPEMTRSGNQDKLLEILAMVNEAKAQDKKKELPPEFTESNDISGPVRNSSARAELALHLSEEQMKIKQQKISSLSAETLPTDSKKLTEVAKKLGIEKGSLEIKKALDKISKDKDSMTKLSEKFAVQNLKADK